MLKFGDRARQTTTTTGTGTISLNGSTPAGWFSFAESGLVSGRTCKYLVELPNGTDFAIIEGTFTSGSPSTLTRDRIIRSKIGGVAGTTNPSLTGTSIVTCVWTAEDADTANPVLFSPSISAGALVIDLDENAESAHKISLDQNISAGGISFVNPPSGYCKVYIEFDQATPGGTTYDVPITAWTGGPGTVTFDTDYAVYQDATPTVVWLTSVDGMATARARMNVELIAYLATSDIDTLAKLNAIVTDADLTSTAHAHTGGLGAQIAYSSLSGLPTLGTAAAQNSTAFEPSGAVATHAAQAQAHGISAFGATLVDDADAATARATLGIGASISDGSTLATGLIFPGTGGIKLRDTNETNTLALQWDVNDTADRTLTFRVAGGNRMISVNTSSISLTALLSILASANGGAAAANKVPYFDGAITGQLADLTADARTLLALVFAANTIPVAATANTLTAQAVGASEVVGRRATGNVGSISYANLKTDLALSNVANVDQLPRSADTSVITANTTIDSTYNGKTIDCNNSGAITLTLADAITANFQCYILRRNTGTVAIARQTTGTLNGAATSISISAQWKSAFVFAYATGAFAVDAG